MGILKARQREQAPGKQSGLEAKACEHKRLVDYARSEGGQTDEIACAECGATLPPNEQKWASSRNSSTGSGNGLAQ